jgi:hypothetical protein
MLSRRQIMLVTKEMGFKKYLEFFLWSIPETKTWEENRIEELKEWLRDAYETGWEDALEANQE